ncbi:MAG: hypothetical protein JEZ08_22365 [Clostridiales bacterium]|nr:hypothetical protein [Clostridiales bacterium]
MKNLERLLVTFATNKVIEECDTSNSRSINFDYIRSIADKHNIMKPEYASNEYLKVMFKSYVGLVFLEMDTFGSDEMFIDEEDEIKYEEGNLTVEDGFTLIVFDNDLHPDFECFIRREREYYEEDSLIQIEQTYKRKEAFLSNVEMDMTSIENTLSRKKLDDEHINHLYFALVELMNRSKAA